MSQSSCECNPGFFLCTVAVALWTAHSNAYDLAKQTGEWAEYELARDTYLDHLSQGGNG